MGKKNNKIHVISAAAAFGLVAAVTFGLLGQAGKEAEGQAREKAAQDMQNLQPVDWPDCPVCAIFAPH